MVGWGEDTSKVLIRLFALPKHLPGVFLYRYATPLYRSHTFVWDLYTTEQQALQGSECSCGYLGIHQPFWMPSRYVKIDLNSIGLALDVYHVRNTVSQCMIGRLDALGLVGWQQQIEFQLNLNF